VETAALIPVGYPAEGVRFGHARRRPLSEVVFYDTFEDFCLAEALDNRIEWGVWGGTSERERRAILRRRPDVRSWKAALSESASV